MRRMMIVALATLPGFAMAQQAPVETFSMQGWRPTLTLGDRNFTMQPVVRLDLDAGTFWDQPQTNGQPPRYDGGVNVRRARLGVQGSFLHDFSYNVTVQFEPGPGNQFSWSTVYPFEAWVAYGGPSWATFRAGSFTPLHTLDFSGSSFETLFMERASIISIASSIAAGDSRYGAGGEFRTDRLFGSIYVSDGVSTTPNDGEQRGIVGRVAGLAVDTDSVKLLIGASGSYQFHPGLTNNEAIRLRDYPQLRLSSLRLLDTGSMPADSGYNIGPELSGTIGKLLFQAEYQRITVNRSDGTNPSFDGIYVALAYPLNGGARVYSPRRAAWTRPPFDELDPAQGHWGYLELATRYSYTNLFDGAVRGGRQIVWGAALNYYPFRSIRTSVEYQVGQVALDGPNRGFQSIGFRIAFDL